MRTWLMAAAALVAAATGVLAQTDPLASWIDGPAKPSITDFVARVTT